MKFNSDKFFSEFFFLLINENNNNLFLDKFIGDKYSVNFIDHINSVCKIMLGKVIRRAVSLSPQRRKELIPTANVHKGKFLKRYAVKETIDEKVPP